MKTTKVKKDWNFLEAGGSIWAVDEPILIIKEPIIIKTLAEQMGLRPAQMMKELLDRNIFAYYHQTIERDVAESILKAHGIKYKFVD